MYRGTCQENYLRTKEEQETPAVAAEEKDLCFSKVGFADKDLEIRSPSFFVANIDHKEILVSMQESHAHLDITAAKRLIIDRLWRAAEAMHGFKYVIACEVCQRLQFSKRYNTTISIRHSECVLWSSILLLGALHFFQRRLLSRDLHIASFWMAKLDHT